MANHNVVPGDCFSSVAGRNGLENYKVLYDHGDNAAIKALRTNPNQLERGDVIAVPPPAPPEPAASNKTHKFQLPRHPVKLRLLLLDSAEAPVKGQKWTLASDRLNVTGTTPASGLIELELPADVTELTLRLDSPKVPKKKKATNVKPGGPYPPPLLDTEFIDADEPESASSEAALEIALKVGSRAPVETADGAMGRLQNLGFGVTADDAADSPAAQRAIQAYQRRYQLAQGALDTIRADLRQRHDVP